MEIVWEVEILKYELVKRNLLSKINPTFVDAGCGDGLHQSNSGYFIKSGWQALLIDALESNIYKCETLYIDNNKVEIIKAILSDKKEEVYFQEDDRHLALSGIKDYIPNRTAFPISQILDNFTYFEPIGILSLDLEGYETPVLKDLIDNKIFPQIIIVEGNTLELTKEHRNMLAPFYGTPIFGVLPNEVFLLNELK